MADDFIVNDVRDPWNQYRNIIGMPSRRRIIFGIMSIIFVLTLIVIAFAVMSKQDNSSVVRQAYASFRSALNASVDPCVDFYNFSCGLWEANNPIPQYASRVTTFSLLQDAVNEKKKIVFENTKLSDDLPRVVSDAVRFYNICSSQFSENYNDTQLLLDYFDQIGGWPILNKQKFAEKTFDWVQSSAFLIKHFDIHTVIGVYSIDNDKTGGSNVIYLKPPTVLQDVEGMLDSMASEQMLQAILYSLNNSVTHPDVYSDIESLRTIESRWHKLLSISRKKSDPLFMSVEELGQQIPQIDWLQYLQLITNDTLLERNETITKNDTVAIDNFGYLKKVVNLLNSNTFSKLELANLFGWFVVKDIWILIPGVLKTYAEWNAYSSDEIWVAARSKCYDLVLDLFPCSFDYLYVKNSTNLEIQDSMILTKYLKSAFQDIIENSHWIDEKTKGLILMKLSKMKDVIGFPSYLKNKTEFNKMYEHFPLLNEVSLSYYFKILQYYVKMRILYLRVPASHLSFLPRSVSDVSAYYIVYKNALVYPISLHNPPFYYLKGPWYLNFGAVGSVIGHEIMHGFDNLNEEDDSKAKWFNNVSRTAYQKNIQCFKDQYDICDLSGVCRNNGTRTLRENIADSEGLHIAFDAYKKHLKEVRYKQKYKLFKNYSPDQLFFIAYGTVWCSKISPSMRKAMVAESHSSPEVRVNNAVSNSKSFALAFNCPEGSPMNPLHKCAMW